MLLYILRCVYWYQKSYFWKIRYLYLVARRPLRLLSMSIVRRITQMSNIHRSQFLYHADFIGIFREVKTWEQKAQVVPFIVPSRILDSGTYLTFTLAILVLFFLGLGLECKNGHKKFFNKALSIYINRLVKVLLWSYWKIN